MIDTINLMDEVFCIPYSCGIACSVINSLTHFSCRNKLFYLQFSTDIIFCVAFSVFFQIVAKFCCISVRWGQAAVGAKLQATNRVPRPVDRGTATRYGG